MTFATGRVPHAGPQQRRKSYFISILLKICIYYKCVFWLLWVFVADRGVLSLGTAGATLWLPGFSWQELLFSQSAGSRA